MLNVYTATEFDGAHAERIGLTSATFDSQAALMARVAERAAAMTAESALALRGTKRALLCGRDTDVARGTQAGRRPECRDSVVA